MTDALASRNNPTNTGNVVRFISVANPPASPEASPASDDGGIASALSARTDIAAIETAGPRRRLLDLWTSHDSSSVPALGQRELSDLPGAAAAKRLLSAIDQLIDELDLNEELLDVLARKR